MSPLKKRVLTGVGAAVLALAVPVVKHFEGTVFKTYPDPALGWKVPTACTGHTGPELRSGQTWTREECDEMLAADLADHNAGLVACVKVPISEEEHAAYLSFAFNVGVNAFCGSTAVRKLNAGDRTGACAELSNWTRSGGKVLPGLVRRRAAERQLCESGL